MTEQPKMRGVNALHLLGSAAVGASLALFLQAWLSSRGRPSLIPPYSMSVMLIALAVLLIVLGVRLRKNIAKGVGAVNPFQAVRLLATARAGQIVGSTFAGFGSGLPLSLLTRSVPAPVETWLPMLATAITAIVLLACALFTEHLCKVPPGENDDNGDEGPGLVTLET